MSKSLNLDVFREHYDKLNDAQREAVDTIEGPVLVVAGPGSGKTELLSVRAANILDKTDAYASDILCLTFTDAAEVNMRRRLTDIIGGEANHIKVHTFHNFCRRIRENNPEHFGVTTDFSVADDIVKTEILEEIFTAMPHDNPLRSEHPDFGFVYRKSVLKSIGDIKQAGLSPNEFAAVLAANESFLDAVKDDVNEVFSQTVSKNIFTDIERLLTTFEQMGEDSPVPHFRSLAYALSSALTRALQEAKEEESTKPITEFKKTYTRKVSDRRVLKAEKDREKMQALADVYHQYEKRKYELGFYDFDDMILEVIQKLEEEPDLRAAVAEENGYIMVDEFQDTNDAQLRLLLSLAQEAPENKPNLLAVGDDDQAIFRFQGAEVSNILNFKHTFPATKIVTLTKNYRSHQHILDVAQTVIAQGEERLHTILDEVEKELEAAGEIGPDVAVSKHVVPTRTHHHHAIARRAAQLIADGLPPSEIAILARRHQDLEALVPYLHEANVPITYERQQNVLAQPHIRQLITMCRLITYLGAQELEEAESFLPETLSYPFWGLERGTVWELSLEANKSGAHWLELMRDRGGRLEEIADFFIVLAERVTHEPVEYVLETLVGAHELPAADSADVDEIETPRTDDELMLSPFKDFYFSRQKLADEPADYLRFLSSLKTFVYALREHKEGTILTTADLIQFVDTHEDNDLVVTDTSPFVNAAEAVHLLSAHKAKGQEFGAVVIAGAVDDVWANTRSRGKLSFPANLPIQFAGDTTDDQLRLLFVAMTRAKHTLDIFSYEVDDNGSEQVDLSFLAGAEIVSKEVTDELPSTESLLESTVPVYHGGPYIPDEKALLSPLVEDYRLSVTHLNNFLDVRYGGPENFLTSNLLRFPQPMSKHQVYGSAIHTALERIYVHLKQEGELPSVELLIEWFKNQIKRSRLPEQERIYLSERGEDTLTQFWQERDDTFSKDHISEYNFRKENVVIDGVPLSGKIDKMVPADDDTIVVHDFKTGSGFSYFSSSSVKAENYKRQLIFYKLLVENAAEFTGKQVNEGVLEFVEPKDGEIIVLPYEITADDVDELKKLIGIVYEHITNLNFPDTSGYGDDMKAVRAFREDLLAGNV